MWYLSKNILERSMLIFFKRAGVSAICVVLTLISVRYMPHPAVESYLTWAVYAVETAAVAAAITLIVNVLLFRKDFRKTAEFFRKTVLKKFFGKI